MVRQSAGDVNVVLAKECESRTDKLVTQQKSGQSSQETINNTNTTITSARQEGQTIHPTGMWQILIPWSSSRFNFTMPHQFNCFTISKREASDGMCQLLA